MAPVLYGPYLSSPVRTCLMTSQALGIDLSIKNVNLLNGEHMKPEFLKISPFHTVPALEDGDFSIWDSHVISAYLVGKHGKDNSLYPKDLQKRSLVDQRMHFDAGILFPRLRAISYPLVMSLTKTIKKEDAANLEDATHQYCVTHAHSESRPSLPVTRQCVINMAPTLYGPDLSPPVRACILTIQALGISVDVKNVNLLIGDHLKPEFLKINPLHTVPAFEDGEFSTWDSHVITAYLVGKYGKDDTLYPKDLQKRAVVDQRMYFDAGILFPRLRAITYPLAMNLTNNINKDDAANLENAYNSLETLLEKTPYVAGDHVTIADFSIVTTVTSANIVVPIASNRFPKISEWLSRMQALPYYSANQVGLDKFAALIRSKLA